MRSRSFFTTILIGNFSLLLMTLGLGFWMTYREVNHRASDLTQTFQEQLLEIVVGEIEERWPDADELIEQYCDTYSKHREFRLTVFDHQGNVIDDSEFDPLKMERHTAESRPELAAAYSGRTGKDTRNSKTMHEPFRYYAAPIKHDEKIVAVVRVGFPMRHWAQTPRPLLRVVVTWFVWMIVSGVLLSILFSWLWHRPLKLITKTAQRIAEGDLEKVPRITGSLELRELSGALDRMRRTVSSQLETIKQQREGFRTILSSLREAIFALDEWDQIVYFNNEALELFQLEPFADVTHIRSFLSSDKINQFYLAHKDGTERASHRIEEELDGKKYVLRLELIPINRDELGEFARILVVRDLTEVMKAGQMKTDFVANASHELRTPLTTIRAALDNIHDGIAEGDPAMLQSMIDMISRHVARLEAMVNDLLALHNVENEQSVMTPEITTVGDQMQWLSETFAPKAEEKNLTLRFENHGNEEPFLIDAKRIGLIMQNLIENAIKFTPEHGNVTMTFRHHAKNKMLTIVCKDTGCGIAPEEQTRVFERFYQANSSRSGDSRARGTGLGLAIVKHAVERLKGKIALRSRPGEGTTVTIAVPVQEP